MTLVSATIFDKVLSFQIYYDVLNYFAKISEIAFKTTLKPNKGKIEITIDDGPNEITTNVKDDGVGISEDKQKIYSINFTKQMQH